MKLFILTFFSFLSFLSLSSEKEIDKNLSEASRQYSVNIDKVKPLLFSAYKMAYKEDNYTKCIESIEAILLYAYHTGDYDLAKKYYNIGVNMSSDVDKVGIMIRFGETCEKTGFYDKAISLYMKSSDLVGDNSKYKCKILINLSSVFLDLKEFNKSLDYARQALKSECSDDHNDVYRSTSYLLIANSYLELSNPDSAIDNYNKCLDIRESNGDRSGVAEVLNNIGLVYQENGDLKLAEQHFLKAYNISIDLNYFLLTAYIENELGDLYREMGQYSKSKNYFKKSLDKEKEAGYIVLTQSLYKNMYTLYNEIGDSENALDYFERFHKISDSINNVNSDQKVVELEARFRTQEKEKEIDHLTSEAKSRDLVIKSKNTIISLAVILSIAAILLSLNIYISRKKQIESNKILKDKNEKITYQKEKMTESIQYAKIIQEATFGDIRRLGDLHENSAIMFNPKDIVSGDFYWFNEIDGNIIFSVADCTGHGVPGALMSMIGNSGINDAVYANDLKKPSHILNHLSRYINSSFREQGIRDSIDIALCSLNSETKELQYSGSRNNLYIFRKNGTIDVIKSDKFDIGNNDSTFTNHTVQLYTGDTVYIMSDGFCDQFGGEKNKKYKISTFKEFVLENLHLSASDQVKMLELEFTAWKNRYDQVDDVCVMALKV